MTMTTTCAHLALAEHAEGWGTCPDCGQMEDGDKVRRDIAERLAFYTEGEYQEAIDESHQQGWHDSNAAIREWAAPRIAMLAEAIETINDRLDVSDQNDEWVDDAIAHLWEVRDDLAREGWAQ